MFYLNLILYEFRLMNTNYNKYLHNYLHKADLLINICGKRGGVVDWSEERNGY